LHADHPLREVKRMCKEVLKALEPELVFAPWGSFDDYIAAAASALELTFIAASVVTGGVDGVSFSLSLIFAGSFRSTHPCLPFQMCERFFMLSFPRSFTTAYTITGRTR